MLRHLPKGASLHFMEIMTDPEPDLLQDTISNEGPIDSQTSVSEDQAPNNQEEKSEELSDSEHPKNVMRGLIEDGQETSGDDLPNMVEAESIWSWDCFDQGCGDETRSKEMESLDSDVELDLIFVAQGIEMGSDGNESGTNIEKKVNQETAQSINKNQNPYPGRGALICLEGIDGAGKTTQIRLIKERLEEFCHKVVTFPPPKQAEAIGCVIDMLRRQYEGLAPLALHLLFAANRLNWSKKICIHLEEGSTVLLDRYVYSGIAYTMALKKTEGKIPSIEWCQFIERGLLPAPDLVINLDIDVPSAIKRIGRRGNSGFDDPYHQPEFLQRVLTTYDCLFDTNWEIVDAHRSPDDITAEICNLINPVHYTCRRGHPLRQIWVPNVWVPQWPMNIPTRDMEERLNMISLEHLTPSKHYELHQLLYQFYHTFVWDKKGLLTCTHRGLHVIHRNEAKPIKLRPHRMAWKEQQIVRQAVQDMLDAGVIRSSRSAWAFPVVLVPKPDGSTRFCIDYRKLNEISKKDAYLSPRTDDALTALSRAKFFTAMDLRSGYWQIPMDSASIEKTAFTTKFGLFEFVRMPFGLSSAVATFQRIMDDVFRDLLWEYVVVYLDDVIIYSENWEDHLVHIREVFRRLREANLKITAKKCDFAKKELQYLGHIVSVDGILPTNKKIQAVESFPQPKTQTEVRSFLGLAGYYRKFIKNFAKISLPLTNLTKDTIPFVWTAACNNAMKTLQQALISQPILTHPDFNLPFLRQTDWCTTSIGAVLAQRKDGGEKVIAYASRQLKGAELNYSATNGECLSVIWAVRYFRPFLYGHRFIRHYPGQCPRKRYKDAWTDGHYPSKST